MRELDNLREVFLSPELDEEDRKDNAEQLRKWEESLLQNEAYAGWQDHDITKQIISQARATFKECALRLANDRALTDEARRALWATQDAVKWFIYIASKDAKGELEATQKEIKTALGAI